MGFVKVAPPAEAVELALPALKLEEDMVLVAPEAPAVVMTDVPEPLVDAGDVGYADKLVTLAEASEVLTPYGAE